MNGSPVKTTRNVLAIDDSAASVQLIRDSLSDLPLRFHGAYDAASGIDVFRRVRPDLVFVDLEMPGRNGYDALSEILEIDPNAQVVVVTAEHSTGAAVESMRRGAVDFITKPFGVVDFRERVTRWLDAAKRGGSAVALDESGAWRGMIGASTAMTDLYARISMFAPHFRTVLIGGDTGTGKELVARAFHDGSPVSRGPYLTCNCASFADSLFESEVFGYVKGAFTGANQDRPGLVLAANGGTLFLDEVGELPLSAQAKLLRVLQAREVRPVGGTVSRPVDIRIVAATNRDLRAMTAERKFREDLYYRLAMLEVRTPTLRERRQDIPLLARHFARMYAKTFGKEGLRISPGAMGKLTHYAWPGNVRELENVIGAAALTTNSGSIEAYHLPDYLESKAAGSDVSPMITLEELTRIHLGRVLAQTGGNRRETAEILGVSRATLYRLLRSIQGPEQPASGSEDSRAFEGAGSLPG